MRFHSTRYGLESWMPFWLATGTGTRLRGLRLRVGPAEDADGIVAATRALLRAVPGLAGEVRASGIPLRD
jgi:hypothetical protein